VIGVNADIAGYFQTLFNDVSSTEVGILEQSHSGRLGERATGADGDQIVFGLNHIAVANKDASLIITGNGDVIQPEDDLIAIGSGGPFAQSAAMALLKNTDLSARDIVEKGLEIAGDICIYTNHNRTIEELDSAVVDAPEKSDN